MKTVHYSPYLTMTAATNAHTKSIIYYITQTMTGFTNARPHISMTLNLKRTFSLTFVCSEHYGRSFIHV